MSNYYNQEHVAQGQEGNPSHYQQWAEEPPDIQQHRRLQEQQPIHQQRLAQTSQLLHRRQHSYTQDSRLTGPAPEQYPNARCRFTSSLHQMDVNPRQHLAHSTQRTGGSPHSLPSINTSYAGYYSHPTTGTNTPEPPFSQPASYPQTPNPFYQQSVQIETQRRSTQRAHGVHPYGRPEQQARQYAQLPDPGLHASGVIDGLHSNPQSSHSSTSLSSSPWSDEVQAADNRSAERNADERRSEVPILDPHTRLQSDSAAPNPITEGTPKASAKRKNVDFGAQHRKSHRSQGKGKAGDASSGRTPSPSMDTAESAVVRPGRTFGACIHCKKVKMKCEFREGEDTCERCKSHERTCIVEGRKPRPLLNRRDYLLVQIKQKDAVIESLLKQLHDPYNTTPVSIASYRMGTSPSDRNNMNVLEWLGRLHANVDGFEGHGGPSTSRNLRDNTGGTNHGSDKEESERWRHSSASPIEVDDSDSSRQPENLVPSHRLSSLLDLHAPLGLIAGLSFGNADPKGKKKERDRPTGEFPGIIGVANKAYFKPGPATDLGARMAMVEQYSLPEIILHGVVTPDDVDRLFDIFYEHINPFVFLLDPVLHTPNSTFARCPFLYNVICAISSKYDIYKSESYPVVMRFAKSSAANAIVDGWKCVELCQAYILMSMYAVPTESWEEDRSWMYAGLAIRVATDLNLHLIRTSEPQSERQEREVLNRIRIWLICCNLDLSMATQSGKPSSVKENYIMRNASEWYKQSKYNSLYDIHLCAQSVLLQIGASFQDHVYSDHSVPTGLNKHVDFCSSIMNYDIQLTSYLGEWLRRFAEHPDANDPSYAFRCSLLPFIVGYSRLVMFSFGFQQTSQHGLDPGDVVFFTKCLEASKFMIQTMIEELAPAGYMRYAPDEYFMIVSFASVFLLKLLQPEYSSFFSQEHETAILNLIGRLIGTLSSQEIAVDDRHTPKLYAQFLVDVLSRHRREGITAGHLHHLPPPANISSAREFSHYSAGTAPHVPTMTDQGGRHQTQGQGFSSSSFDQTIVSVLGYDTETDPRWDAPSHTKHYR